MGKRQIEVIEGEFSVEDQNIDLDQVADEDESEQSEEIEDEEADQSSEDEEDESEPESEEDELVVLIDGEVPQEDDSKAPNWVKELRKNYRDLQREKRELQEKLKLVQAPEKKAELPPKPSLKDADIDYDEDKFDAKLATWYEQKRKVEEQEAIERSRKEAEDQEWRSKLDAYENAKKELKVKDFEDSEVQVKDIFSTVQQGILLHGSDNAAILVYALGKSPKKAKELSAITDPVKFAFAVSKLESNMKVTKRKAPQPEKVVSKGSAPVSGRSDAKLERLRLEAEKTGDYTKVMAYKRANSK